MIALALSVSPLGKPAPLADNKTMTAHNLHPLAPEERNTLLER